MMNNENLQVLGSLKGMFPNFDEEILLSALFQNGDNIEKTIDCLLALQADNAGSNFTKNQQKELSLFNNVEGITNKEKEKRKEQPIRKEPQQVIRSQSLRENTDKAKNSKPQNDNKLYIDDKCPVVNKLDVNEGVAKKKSITQKLGSNILIN
jgi:hypothetical protein